MTKDEFYERYQHVDVKFAGYYKFTFFFEARLSEDLMLSVEVGGDADSIHHLFLAADQPESVGSLRPRAAHITRTAGGTVEVIDSYYDDQNPVNAEERQ